MIHRQEVSGQLMRKKHDAVLKGEGYTQPVTYWMPFNGNVGIHDADTWRSEYGGEIYKNQRFPRMCEHTYSKRGRKSLIR